MLNETLLDRAEFNYVTALKAYKYSLGDERDLNIVGYLLQQSTELVIKHVLECNGIRYAHSYIIEDLIDDAMSKGCHLAFTEQFYDFTPAISKWESKTRYIKNYTLAQKQIEKGFVLIKEFLLMNGASNDKLKLPEVKLKDISAF